MVLLLLLAGLLALLGFAGIGGVIPGIAKFTVTLFLGSIALGLIWLGVEALKAKAIEGRGLSLLVITVLAVSGLAVIASGALPLTFAATAQPSDYHTDLCAGANGGNTGLAGRSSNPQACQTVVPQVQCLSGGGGLAQPGGSPNSALLSQSQYISSPFRGGPSQAITMQGIAQSFLSSSPFGGCQSAGWNFDGYYYLPLLASGGGWAPYCPARLNATCTGDNQGNAGNSGITNVALGDTFGGIVIGPFVYPLKSSVFSLTGPVVGFLRIQLIFHITGRLLNACGCTGWYFVAEQDTAILPGIGSIGFGTIAGNCNQVPTGFICQSAQSTFQVGDCLTVWIMVGASGGKGWQLTVTLNSRPGSPLVSIVVPDNFGLGGGALAVGCSPGVLATYKVQPQDFTDCGGKDCLLNMVSGVLINNLFPVDWRTTTFVDQILLQPIITGYQIVPPQPSGGYNPGTSVTINVKAVPGPLNYSIQACYFQVGLPGSWPPPVRVVYAGGCSFTFTTLSGPMNLKFWVNDGHRDSAVWGSQVLNQPDINVKVQDDCPTHACGGGPPPLKIPYLIIILMLAGAGLVGAGVFYSEDRSVKRWVAIGGILSLILIFVLYGLGYIPGTLPGVGA